MNQGNKIMEKCCISAIISGKVQGVFYRDTTRRKAQSLSITGWVKNNVDGTVELHACGDAENIKTFVDWLWEGPSVAEVDDVIWQEIGEEKYDRFSILQ
ncbi:MAG: hypothetical protein A3F13_01430 [Gammaproteobacteria bacterium RIFCSPHIGHO2_12_FULL_40_19]|nr:MAG: hypothetical protein A3F13_01430 [Gammaproteobacteria bacterium RIFCSPHIGHO2_12_FULL_40_19]